MEEQKQKPASEVVALNYTPEDLAAIQAMAVNDGAPADFERLPVLRINYAPLVQKLPEGTPKPRGYIDSGNFTIPLGAWVVGQRKELVAGTTDKYKVLEAEQGEEVQQIVIYKIRKQFSFYDQKESKNNCHSPIYADREEVRGSNYGHVCGNTCPYRAEGRTPRCKLNNVVFVSAITKSRKTVDAVAYIHGANFMDFVDFIKTAVNVKLPNGTPIKLPVFSFITELLETEEKTNGTIVYYVAKWKKGAMFKREIVDKMEIKAAGVDSIIDTMNARSVAAGEDDNRAAASGGQQTPPPADSRGVPLQGADPDRPLEGVIVSETRRIDEGNWNPEDLYTDPDKK